MKKLTEKQKRLFLNLYDDPEEFFNIDGLYEKDFYVFESNENFVSTADETYSLSVQINYKGKWIELDCISKKFFDRYGFSLGGSLWVTEQ